jgi:hypothetical protein
VNSLHTVWDTCIIEKKLGTDPQTIARDLLDGLPMLQGQAGRITRGISAADRRSGHRQFDYGVSAGNG